MKTRPGILLLDDGELAGVAALLDRQGLDYQRMRSSEIEGSIPPPCDLLVTTPRHAHVVRRGSPTGARPGRPVRIIAAGEDSTAMRRMLRNMGFHLLVRLPCQESIWRLLIRRALYQGDERRAEDRIAMGSPVAVDHEGSDQGASAMLLDVSNRGCRLASSVPLPLDSEIRVTLGARTTGGEILHLPGRVVRAAPESRRGETVAHQAAILFDADMDESLRARLVEVINRWSMGPPTASDAAGAPQLPPCESRAIPGLLLDDETDPAIRIGEQVELHVDGSPTSEERRVHARGAYASPVVATAGQKSRVLMGRDLSAGGMRVERMSDLRIGDRLRLALYGPSPVEPFHVSAVVIRDDGEDGLALAFEHVDPGIAESLEKLVACLPEVESLEASETHGLGAILSEVLDDD